MPKLMLKTRIILNKIFEALIVVWMQSNNLLDKVRSRNRYQRSKSYLHQLVAYCSWHVLQLF